MTELKDELLDALPASLRTKILKTIEVDDEGNVTRVVSDEVTLPPVRTSWGLYLLWILSFFWAMPWVLVGGLLCATIVLFPIGIPIIVVGCAPCSAVTAAIIRRKHAQ